MLSVRKPTDEVLRRLLTMQSRCDFSYPDPGLTLARTVAGIPSGFTVDHTRVRPGDGEATYRTAVDAIRHWQQFALGWVEATPVDTPIAPDATIAVVARLFGAYSVNCARIVETIDDRHGPTHGFGFAYGTLPDHIEAGEERFLVEWNTTNNQVSYDILAYSRPRYILAKLGYPVVRRLQKRFARDSAARMQRLSRRTGRFSDQ